MQGTCQDKHALLEDIPERLSEQRKLSLFERHPILTSSLAMNIGVYTEASVPS
jgi:hypothetical protein